MSYSAARVGRFIKRQRMSEGFYGSLLKSARHASESAAHAPSLHFMLLEEFSSVPCVLKNCPFEGMVLPLTRPRDLPDGRIRSARRFDEGGTRVRVRFLDGGGCGLRHRSESGG